MKKAFSIFAVVVAVLMISGVLLVPASSTVSAR